ncbi:hypothetical protein [Brevundimonas sp. TWP1-2-1b1]|uniref:hypothetical protein n=1 Tax=unclassified Brevundimonas TaxID=2622653 RepID=UPI003CED8FA4
MQPHTHSSPNPDRADDYRIRPAAEPHSWAPRAAQGDLAWGASAGDARPTFTHNAARYSRPAEATASMEQADVEPELSAPPRWMMAIAGAAVAALMGALLGGFMHI